MEMLLFALDGMDKDLAHRYDMPVLQELINSSADVAIHEDLWTRGWAEVLSGLPGTETGAYYEKPKLNGKPEFTQGFGTRSYDNLSNAPLWELLSHKGVRCGWFAMPTTMPAAEVKGFMFSGAGGGVSPSDRIPPKACHPKEMQQDLIWSQTVWENRYVESAQRSCETFISKCINTVWERTRKFCELCRRYGPLDFAAVLHKESVILTNLFMHDILRPRSPYGEPGYVVQQLLRRFYQSLDDSIGYALNQLKATHAAVVSDHGAGPLRNKLNLNGPLVKAGLTAAPIEKPGLKQVAKRLLGRNRLHCWDGEKKVPAFNQSSYGPVKHAKSRAFANWYVPGVYVCDERFGGPVQGETAREQVTTNIIKAIKADPGLARLNLNPRPYRSKHANAGSYDLLPDVWVDMPPDCFPTGQGPTLRANYHYRSYEDLAKCNTDIASGMKTHNALCAFPKALVENLPDSVLTGDLRTAYNIISMHFDR